MPIEPAVLLNEITSAGEKGTTFAKLKTKFCKGKLSPKESDLVGVLKYLLDKKNIIGPITVGRSKQYFESVPAKIKINRFIHESGTKLMLKSDLIKKCVEYDDPVAHDAIRELIAEGVVMELKCGKAASPYLLHRSVASEYLKFVDAEKTHVLVSPSIITSELVLPVYEQLKSKNRGIETVLIYDLIKALNVSKEALHQFIRHEAKADRASFHTAAAVTLSQEVLDAGIHLEGESHPYVSVVFRSNL